MPTFREAAETYFAENAKNWRGTNTAKGFASRMAKHAYPVIGDMAVNRIETTDVLNILTDDFWTKSPAQARKTRQHIRVVLSRCKALGHVKGDNAAGEAIDAVRKPHKATGHLKTVAPDAIADVLAKIEAGRASQSVKLAFRFGVLCASRFGEVRNATWDEIDMDARRWRIPAGKMKMNEPHDVPLSDAAMAVLTEARKIHDGDLVFPSIRGGGVKPISRDTMRKVVQSAGIDAVPHALARATFPNMV